MKLQITAVTQPHYSPDLVPCDFWLFPKLKSPLKGKRFQTVNSGKYDGAADGNWENCVKSQGAYFEGDYIVIVLCTMFLVPCILFNKHLYFSYYMAGYLLDRPHMCTGLLSESPVRQERPAAYSSPGCGTAFPSPQGPSLWAPSASFHFNLVLPSTYIVYELLHTSVSSSAQKES